MDDPRGLALVGGRIQFGRLRGVWPPRVEVRPAVQPVEVRSHVAKFPDGETVNCWCPFREDHDRQRTVTR